MRASLAGLLGLACLLSLSASRCSPIGSGGGKTLSILAYNAHNLFDARDDGAEYDEFSVARGRWDEARYRARLAAVGEVVAVALPDGAWPDILCLEEIEGRRVLEDLAAGPLKAASYRYLGIAPAEGSPINNGILSRLPIASLKAHALAPDPADPGPGRNLLEARIAAGGRELSLFVLHWKSKIGGPEATEERRREAAGLLASRVAAILEADPRAEIVACGDFNENPDEYRRRGRRYPTALMPADEAEPADGPEDGPAGGPAGEAAPSRLLLADEPSGAGLSGSGEPVLYSPWSADAGYSYSYKGERERLDGFLLASGLFDGEGLAFRGFCAVDAPFLLDPEGEPIAWSAASPKGYSDHLPVLLILEAEGS